MDQTGNNEKIGISWIIAMIVLLGLLLVGTIFYLQTGINLAKPHNRVSLVVSKVDFLCCHPRQLCGFGGFGKGVSRNNGGVCLRQNAKIQLY